MASITLYVRKFIRAITTEDTTHSYEVEYARHDGKPMLMIIKAHDTALRSAKNKPKFEKYVVVGNRQGYHEEIEQSEYEAFIKKCG